MKKHRRHLAEANFWPGYVDALVNVVLNLLFMVAIFAVGVFCMGLQATAHPKNGVSTQGLMQQTSKSFGVDKKAESHSGPIMLYVGNIEARNTSGNFAGFSGQLINYVRNGNGSLSIRFSRRGDEIGYAEKGELNRELRALGGKSSGEWIVSSNISTRNAIVRRVAYAKVLLVRGALIQVGISEAAIRMELREEDEEVMDGLVTVNVQFKKG